MRVKKTNLGLMLVAVTITAIANAAEKPLKVLSIGNSFSICLHQELPSVVKGLGREIDLATLYIGGCTINRHWENVEKEGPDYRPYRYDRGGKQTVNNIPEALRSEKWDVVTIQQGSHESWRPETYEPNGTKLLELIRRLAPTAKIMIQETWNYLPSLNGWHREMMHLDRVEMYELLRGAYYEFATRHGLELIPVGDAKMFASNEVDMYGYGDFHFGNDGKYLQALVWAGKLFGLDPLKCSYDSQYLTKDRCAEMRTIASKTLGHQPQQQRIFRSPRNTRGNTNIVQLQPIDRAAVIWAKKQRDIQALRFRCTFEAKDEPLIIDVSADERFYLTLDGEFVARGPNRGTVENWQYQTYIFNLAPGRHVFEATVWRHGWGAPLAQMTAGKGGFILKANAAYDQELTTGYGPWQVGELVSTSLGGGSRGGSFGIGESVTVKGSGLFTEEPVLWEAPEVLRMNAGKNDVYTWGGRTGDWLLFPSQLPDQIEVPIKPGEVRAINRWACSPDRHCHYAEENKTDPLVKDFNALLRDGKALTIPAKTTLHVAWDLGDYYCGYPMLVTSAGQGASVRWGWAEAGYLNETGASKNGYLMKKGDRNEIAGKHFDPFQDVFLMDGRKDARFTTTWWRCGKWVELDIRTDEEPLVISEVKLIESRYPLENHSRFVCDDETLNGIRKLCTRGMQMCCHEMLFDCPYYEQQMYPGDTRVQLQVLTAMDKDDSIIRRAMELYDLARRDDGTIPMNWPTRGTQESVTYSLCYLCMYGDYLMWHRDDAWLKARLPGVRHTLSGIALYENREGLLENLPGWSFMDWVPGWEAGTAPDSRCGDGISSVINLFYALSMQAVARVERYLGNEEMGEYWQAKTEKLMAKIIEKFWDEGRGMLADELGHKRYSEHAQCLALLGDLLPGDKAKRAWEALLKEQDLARTTVYFSYYLFETYFKYGRGDLFLKRLDLWRDYVKLNMCTPLESPGDARSDCHAWGSHPLFFMNAGLAGVRPTEPGFARVSVRPAPGDLKFIEAEVPHPRGSVKVQLKFVDGKAVGSIDTPVPGCFEFGGVKVELKPGQNEIK